jgi:FkbM family methyltransferase
MIADGLRWLRSTVRGSGIGRLPFVAPVYQWIYDRTKPTGIVTLRIHGQRMSFQSSDTGLAPSLLQEGIYEPEITEYIDSHLEQGMTFVDVGANFGFFSMIAGSKVGENGTVISIEPEPKNFALLQKNIHTNGYQNRTKMLPIALSQKEGTATLFVDDQNVGNHSLAQSNIKSGTHAVTVCMRRLDDVCRENGIDTIDMMKIDTQGAELQVLLGATELLPKTQTILFECWPYGMIQMGDRPEELFTLLSTYGFSLLSIDNRTPMSAEEIFAYCNSSKGGRGSIDLLALRG